MLIKKDLESMVDGQGFETVALMKGYDVKVAKTGSKYIDGLVEMKGSVQFKVWAGRAFDEMDKYDYSDTICKISGKVNEYNGIKSLVISDIKALDEGTYDKADFFEDKYPVEAYWEAFDKLVKKVCTANAYAIFGTVFADIKDRFKVEFAARGHHDAVKGGLLAHTYKETALMVKVLKFYPAIVKVVDLDLLILGCAIHDIGKVYEYTNGVIKGNGLIVSHHTFGVELLCKHKENIIDLKGEEFYYRLLAIIEQHHGEFEETPRAIEAYLVHLIDNLESRFQIINESFEKDLDTIGIDGFKLK